MNSPCQKARVPAWESTSHLTVASIMASPFLSITDSTTSTVGHEDAFLGFVEYARSMISSDAEEDPDAGGGGDPPVPPWSWVVSKILKSCMAYSSGVTPAILLSDLFQVVSFSSLDQTLPLSRFLPVSVYLANLLFIVSLFR